MPRWRGDLIGAHRERTLEKSHQHLLYPPNPADFTQRGARILLHSVYHWVQQNLNHARAESGEDMVPDRFPLDSEFIDALVAESSETISDFGRVLHLYSNREFLKADELYRRWFGRTRAKQLKEYRKHLAKYATEQKSKQARELKQQVLNLASVIRARRPGRSNRAIAMDLAAKLDKSPETIRKLLTRAKHKPK